MTDEISTIAPLRSDADQRVELAVSVIIPHYNDLQNLERCIGLLAAQTLPRDQYEVVVADNNSRCGIDAVRRVCGKIARVVPAPIQGAGPARNAAVAASRGKVLAFIDSDCRPSSSWLERGLAALSSAQIVGGRVDVDYVDPSRPTAEEAFERVFAFNFKRYIREVGFSGSGNMFVPREIFDNVGGFRAQVAEDVDWGQRALIANYRFAYADDVVVSHPARRSWTELTQKWGKATREAYASAIEKPNGRSGPCAASPFWHRLSFIGPRSPRRPSSIRSTSGSWRSACCFASASGGSSSPIVSCSKADGEERRRAHRLKTHTRFPPGAREAEAARATAKSS